MLKVFEAFAGYGSQSIALRNIGVEYEVVAISEIDKYAIKAYEAIHGQVNNLGDISKIKVEDIPKHDLFTYSFPCFVAGTKVMTDKGYKNIENIQSGDKVLTHTNSYQEVVKPMVNKANHLYKIDTMCSDSLYTTEEHPFYIREKYREWNNSKRMYDRKFKTPQWIKAKDLNKNCYVGIAINQKNVLPHWDGSAFVWSDGKKNRNSNILKGKFDIPEFWWLIGRYIGDGWIRSRGGVIICCAYGEEKEIIPKLDKLGFNYSISKERTVIKLHIAFKGIGEYVEQFGRGARNKHLTSDIFDLPCDLLKEFIEGYKSADGCFSQGLNKITSISQELIYGIGQCIAKVYHRPFSIYKTVRPKNCNIEGRVVNQKDTYQITWKQEHSKQDKAFYDGGYIWCPVNKIERIDYDGLVYNMEVANDNSYTVNNIIVHNCQDISVAGRQRGIEKGKTRSGLLYECEKIIEHCRPKYLLMENVKNLVGKKFKAQFDEWLAYLESLGYTNYWKVLNAKDYGVPQNRERVFVVSILGEHKPYKFPSEVPLEKRLKDVLENNTDDKYVLKSVKDFFIKNSFDMEYAGNGFRFKPHVRKNADISNTLTTRCGGRMDDNFIIDLDIDESKFEYSVKFIKEFMLNNDYQSRFLNNLQDDTVSNKLPKGDEIKIIGTTQNKETKGTNCRHWVHDLGGIIGALSATDYKQPKQILDAIEGKVAIRKLTPKECFRLMGMKDSDIDKIQETGLSNTQQYKMAGNSIVINVLEGIFYNLFMS